MRRPSLILVGLAAAAALFVGSFSLVVQGQSSEAPTGFDVESNGFAEEFCANQDALVDSPNSPMIPDDECSFDTAAEEFTGPEGPDDGLGPIFNAAGCGECHIVPALGGSSQINEKRAGLFSGGVFTEHAGGSLIQDRALDPATQERIDPFNTNVIAFRSSLSLFGDGFVEAINSNTIAAIRAAQPAAQRGLLIQVPVLEAPGNVRVGRFGHKNQQASLLSFSADAYVNEMGITSPLQPVENTSNGTPVFDPHPGEPAETDDEGVDVELFALFMRSLLAPPRGPIGPAESAGATVFNNIGCAVCHTPTITTSAPGTIINGGALKVANAVANKVIHPFGDFLLHDIGTGDGIVQNGGAASRNTVRTLPLWGVRAKGRFMHDALSFSLRNAISRHGNQAAASRAAFNALSTTNQNRVIAFLLSL